MNPSQAKGYGNNRLAVWRAGFSDRLRGAHARANARMGYLRAPGGTGRVVWIKAGGSRESVRLGVELLGAIRQKRLDVRLVLTFEEDYADILEQRVRGMKKIGLGYGPCDLQAVVKRTLARLEPFAIVLVDTQPHRHLLELAKARDLHVVAFNTPPSKSALEAAYPVDELQAAAWREQGTAQYVAPAADPLSLFVEAQVDTTLKSLVCGGEECPLWWWHDALGSLPQVIRAWRESALAENGVLFVSGADAPRIDESAVPRGVDVRISLWQRDALEPGCIVLVDDPRWLPAVGSGASATHLAQASRFTLWEALAGGSALTVSQHLLKQFPRLHNVVDALDDIPSVFSAWQEHAASPFEARQRGDACRRLFWDERRQLQSVMDEFLQRVFDW